MKKSIIAGSVASIALAAMPVMGVFATATVTESFVETLNINVDDACEFGNESNTGTATDTVLPNGTTTWDNHNTVLSVRCTLASYKITSVFTAMGRGANATAWNADDAKLTYSGAATSGGSQTWAAQFKKNSGTFAYLTNNSSTQMTGTSSQSDTFTIKYEAGLGADQPAGTYTGTATYTIATGASS